MKKSLSQILSAAFVVGVAAFGTVAFANSASHESAAVAPAHDTGHESRTKAQCEALPGTETSGDRGLCLSCIKGGSCNGNDKSWKGACHFHPDMNPHCRPDNGKPE
ncbi:MAG TPA: hypothetical protein VGL81_29025 [Polyangiaceae bacterium]|jgi:hypothetical protein